MKRIFLLLLVLCTSFMLFACGDEPCTEHKDENNDGTCDVCGEAVVKEPNEIALIKDGAATFKIVLPAGASGGLRSKIQNDIVAVLHNLDVEVEVLDDVSEGKTECEVLINTVTTRGDKYNIDPHYLGAKGYAVKLVGTKVMIMAGSDKALDDAIKYFVKEVLGISGKTKSLDNVTMTKEMSFEEIQDDYDIDSVSVAGNNLKDYVIAVDMSNGMDTAVANAVQSLIYEKCGIWLKCVPIATEASKKFVIKTVLEACEEGFSVTVDNGNIVMECEFPEKFEDAALGFVRTHITSKTGEVKLTATLSYTKNVRVIYYKEFGAKGDGKTDDFIAIRNCHNYANKHGHELSIT